MLTLGSGLLQYRSMIEQAHEDTLSVMKEIEANPKVTQRTVSKKLGISLGKTNYLIRELIAKGLVKGESFSSNPGKLKKISYILTSKGLEEKINLIHHFLKKKEIEYYALKDEWEKSRKGA
jgi:EPS-associated MarR family transcriptional regulator